MGYTALERIRERNFKMHGIENRPMIPPLPTEAHEHSLAFSALSFLRELCEELRFDSAIKSCKTENQRRKIRSMEDSRGKSFSGMQIPLEMEMDIDRLCLERTLADFLSDGTTYHAYLVYFCYLEMFWDNKSNDPRQMVELLSEFERKTSPLLRNHRDHFSHSVYVFSIGLAIYQQSKAFRIAYAAKHCFQNEKEAAHHFLKYWGFTALFHDLGYPFELAYEQIGNYFDGKNNPAYHVIYHNNKETKPDRAGSPYQAFYKAMLSGHTLYVSEPLSANKVFAVALTDQLYEDFQSCPDYQAFLEAEAVEDSKEQYCRYLLQILDKKPSDPEEFNNHIDHAYFSAYLMLHQLWKPAQMGMPETEYLNPLTAILLHNSLFKYSIIKDACSEENYMRLQMETHPLAYLLMLCDELQCWNRFGYGKNTRRENHPIACDLYFNGEEISALYTFDEERRAERSGTYKKFCGTSKPYPFLSDIEGALSINGKAAIRLSVNKQMRQRHVGTGEPLSETSFAGLYQLATLLNGEYRTRDNYNQLHKPRSNKKDALTESERLKMFGQLSLEYKLANLYQVLRFANHLDRISCFFTDRHMSFPEQAEFDEEQLLKIGAWEHDSWKDQKLSMGWQAGSSYLNLGSTDNEQNKLRELLREHQYLDISFCSLNEDKKQKDMEPFRLLQGYLKEYYQVRIYQLRTK